MHARCRVAPGGPRRGNAGKADENERQRLLEERDGRVAEQRKPPRQHQRETEQAAGPGIAALHLGRCRAGAGQCVRRSHRRQHVDHARVGRREDNTTAALARCQRQKAKFADRTLRLRRGARQRIVRRRIASLQVGRRLGPIPCRRVLRFVGAPVLGGIGDVETAQREVDCLQRFLACARHRGGEDARPRPRQISQVFGRILEGLGVDLGRADDPHAVDLEDRRHRARQRHHVNAVGEGCDLHERDDEPRRAGRPAPASSDRRRRR